MKPDSTCLGGNDSHFPHTICQIGAFFNDRPPGGPHSRALARQGEQVAECLHILIMQPFVSSLLHIIGAGGALGIDIEHKKAVVTVAVRDTLSGFKRGVKRIGRGG